MKKQKLGYTAHAMQRMNLRGITYQDILDVLASGLREPSENGAVFHWSMKSHIGVVVDWKNMVIVTVLYLDRVRYDQLMTKEYEKRGLRYERR